MNHQNQHQCSEESDDLPKNLQEQTQYVLAHMQQGDLRAEWFFDKLCERLGINKHEAIQRTILASLGGH